MKLADPFLGEIWMGMYTVGEAGFLRLVIAIKRSWDLDLLLKSVDVREVAESLGTGRTYVAHCETTDHQVALVVAMADRLGVMVLEERIADVLSLGGSTAAAKELFRTAAAAADS